MNITVTTAEQITVTTAEQLPDPLDIRATDDFFEALENGEVEF